MAIEVVMPQLGLTMTEGKIVRWLKREGETVAKGELLIEVETDKAMMEVEAPGAGILGQILVEGGATLPVGQTIAWIIRPGEVLPQSAAPVAPSALPSVQEARAARGGALPKPTDSEVELGTRASPIARRIAHERGIDLSQIRGTGPGGRITQDDVLRAVPAPSAPQGELVELGRIRKLTAERMASSFQTVPHFYITVEADANDLIALHAELAPAVEAQTGVKLSLTDLLVAATALNLRKHPFANAAWADGKVRLNPNVHIALATATDEGLVVPVIHDADRQSLAGLARIRKELVQKAKAGKLSLDDLTGATFTLSNLGMYGIDTINPIINPPQSAILGVGRIRERCVPFKGQVAIRSTVHLTLSVDHRVLDGHVAAEFLRGVSELVENPQELRSLAVQ